MSSPHILGTDRPTAEPQPTSTAVARRLSTRMGWCEIPPSPLVCWGQLNRRRPDGLRTFGSLLDLVWTRWFSSSVRKPLPRISEKWTKTSFDPSSRSDKTEALLTVEPLHSSLRHLLPSSRLRADVQNIRARLTGLMMDEEFVRRAAWCRPSTGTARCRTHPRRVEAHFAAMGVYR